MEVWTLTKWAVFGSGLLLVLAYVLHRWGLISRRAEIAGQPGIGAWLKARWDWALAGIGVLLPLLYQGGLDTVIIVANLVAQLFPAVAGMDLSGLMLSAETRTYIQIGAVAMPLIRDAIEKMRGK